MLNTLRKRLTFICVVTTGILLALVVTSILWIFESQWDKQSTLAFQNHLNSMIYKIQASRLVDDRWLAQMEAGNDLIIAIQDKDTPLSYQGAWTPLTDRNTLINAAKKKAQKEYLLNIDEKPSSILNVSSAVFKLKGNHRDQYQAAVATIPSADGWQGLVLLHDMTREHDQKITMRMTLCLIVFCSLLFLFLFSWWFAGRAIAPLEKNRKKQVEFIAAASHELRSPLAVIRACLSAADSSETKPENKKFLQAAEQESQRMSSLIGDLLFLASTDANTWTIQKEEIEIDTLLIDLYEAYEPIARQKGYQLSLSLPDYELPVLHGDRQRLWQALSILLDNAFSYTQQAGSIALQSFISKNVLLLKVIDNGPGIPDDQKDKVFDRFYRGDPARNKKEHYGLGLSIAKEIIELHQGTISVENTPIHGATFVIRIGCS